MSYIPPVAACLNLRLNQYQKYLPSSTYIWCFAPYHAPVCLCTLHMHAENLVNMKSEPNIWLVKTLQYVLSSFFFLFTSCSLSIYGGLTSLIPFSQSHLQLLSALISALDSAKHTRCEGPAALSSFSSITKKFMQCTSLRENSLITNKEKDKP